MASDRQKTSEKKINFGRKDRFLWRYILQVSLRARGVYFAALDEKNDY